MTLALCPVLGIANDDYTVPEETWRWQQSLREAKSPEDRRYENACLLLTLGPQEMKPVLTETLNHPRSQEILRTPQGGPNTKASTQCQEAKARDASVCHNTRDGGEQNRPAGTSAARGSAHLSPLLWSHLWLPGVDFADTNVIIIMEMYILRAKQRLNGQSYHLMLLLFLCYTAGNWGWVKLSK